MTLAERTEAMTDRDPGRLGPRPGAGAHDPVTGPMPALAMHDGRMQVHARRDVLIVTLDGGAPTCTFTLVAAHHIVDLVGWFVAPI